MRLLILALFVTGCMNFDWRSGKLSCGADGECPSGLVCADSQCVTPDEAMDVVTDDSSEGDTDKEVVGSDDMDSEFQPDSESIEESDSQIICGELVCSPWGSCDDVKCDEKDGKPVCIHGANAEICPLADCGIAECDTDDFYCRYVPNDEDCLGGEECLEASCEASKEGEPPECTRWMDPWLCEPGHICSELDGYQCQQGMCYAASVGEEAALTSAMSRSYTPSVVRETDGFAAVWINDTTSSGYGRINFLKFNGAGKPLLATLKQITTEKPARFPVLLYLGTDRGFAVVHQGWNSGNNTHQIYLIFLGANGSYDDIQYEISTDVNSFSYYPAAALHEPSMGIGVVWTDDRNETPEGSVQKDIYAAVFDVRERRIVTGNQRVTDTTNHEYWPEIVATANGFVVAMQRKNEQLIATRRLGLNAVPLGALESIVPSESATRPIALALGENDEIGIAWRDVTQGENQPKIAFALLDSDGKRSPKTAEPIILGSGLLHKYYDAEQVDYVGDLDLAWNADRRIFVAIWDTAPLGMPLYPDNAEIFAACINMDNPVPESPWQLSFDDNRSIMPAFALQGGVGLVVWHDNRKNIIDDKLVGEVYKATFGSNN